MKRWSFHVQQNLTPERLSAILAQAMSDSLGSPDLASLALECRLSVRVLEKVVLPFVRQATLLGGQGVSLTEVGERLRSLSQQVPVLLPEAMHLLLYTLHHFDPGKHFSWAYGQVVDALWRHGEQPLAGETKAQLVGTVVEEATRTFAVSMEHIAFSRDSVGGVLNWLRALEPPAVVKEGANETFRRRYFCPVPTFLWAVDYLYRVADIAYGVRLFLTPERIEQLCKLCVLDPAGLDNVLLMAKRTSDYDRGGVFDYGTAGGFGRWLLLVRPCPVPTLPREPDP